MTGKDSDITRCGHCGDWKWERLCRTCLRIASRKAARITTHLHLMEAINERNAA